LAHLSRRELKEDRLRTAFEDYEAFAKEHYREIVATVLIAAAVAGAAIGLKVSIGRIEATANAKLGAALDTYNAYVGTPAPGMLPAGTESYPTAQEKYQKALAEFQAVTEVSGIEKLLPQLNAVRIARYHIGLCQAHLGEDAQAIQTFQRVEHDSDSSVASLAQLALAGEYAKTGKLQEAVKTYQNLADHSTATVPRSTALLALADAYRATQPAQARQIYEKLAKEYGSDPTLAEVLKQQISSLPE
jgi:Tetratricopeptide repeat